MGMSRKYNAASPFDLLAPLTDQCVSPSAINEFEQCNAKYLWNRIFKIDVPEEPYQPAIDGERFHKWAEEFFPQNLSLEDLKSISRKPQNYNLPEHALRVIGAEYAYLKENNMEKMTILDVEKKVSSWLNRRIGYADRIDIRPDGNLTVIDYKPNDKRKYPDDVRRQLTFYATQINFLIEQGLYLPNFPEARVTHCRVIGYKDGSDWEFKIKNVTIKALEKRIKKIRTQTHFPCNPGHPLCKWCKFQDNICLQANEGIF